MKGGPVKIIMDTSVNDGMFDLSWSVSLQSDLNAYYVWFYIIPINDVSSSSFDDGEYTGEGVEISSWGYNTPHTSVTHQFQYIASTNSISYSDTLSVKNRPLGSITDNAYVLLCVQTMNSLGQYDYAYDTCYISLVPETLSE